MAGSNDSSAAPAADPVPLKAEEKKIESLSVADDGAGGARPAEEPKVSNGRLQDDPDDSDIKAFLEVLCKSSGKVRRFAAGTTAGFASRAINHKSDAGGPRALYIEAVKEGEEPISFGANAVLVNYGKGWKLQTVLEGDEEAIRSRQMSDMFTDMGASFNLNYSKKASEKGSNLSCQYVAKILLAFVFMFVLGGILTFFLENLPDLISSSTSKM